MGKEVNLDRRFSERKYCIYIYQKEEAKLSVKTCEPYLALEDAAFFSSRNLTKLLKHRSNKKAVNYVETEGTSFILMTAFH